MRQVSCARNRWLGVAIVCGICLLLALLDSVQTYIAQLASDKPISAWLALDRSFKEWLACGVVSLGVLWFCGKNRLEPGRTSRWVLLHCAVSILFWAGYVALTAWLVAGERSVQTGDILTFTYLVKHLAIHYCLMTLLLYWMVVMAHLGWHYYQRLRERELESATLQRELTEARLDTLRLQLNPHFLFNTLHTVSALIHENPEGADRVLARLSDLLRLTLDQSKPQEVSLAEELAFLDLYLQIEQTRFADRLRVEKDIEAGAEKALVPYLILQPIVENAIRHGIEPREDAGRLAIQARRNNGRLELRISDNGPGLAEQTNGTYREGIGLSNTRSRLRHLYGQDHDLELVTAPGGGLEARISIPFRRDEGQGSRDGGDGTAISSSPLNTRHSTLDTSPHGQ